MISWLKRFLLTTRTTKTSGTHPAKNELPTTLEDAWRILGNVNDWVKHAETKLGVTLAFLGVLAAGLISLAIEAGRPSCVMLWIESLTGLCLLLAIGAAALGLLPRRFAHSRDDYKANPVYYRDIYRQFGNPQDYAKYLKTALTDHERMLDALAHQILANSAVADRKYTWTHRAILLGFLSVVGTGVAALGLALGW